MLEKKNDLNDLCEYVGVLNQSIDNFICWRTAPLSPYIIMYMHWYAYVYKKYNTLPPYQVFNHLLVLKK